MSQASLAKKFQCGSSTVSDIIANGHGDDVTLDGRLVRGEVGPQIALDLNTEAKNRRQGAKRSRPGQNQKPRKRNRKPQVWSSTRFLSSLT